MRGLHAWLVLAVLAACRSPDAGTSLWIQSTLDASVGITQLRFTLRNGNDLLLDPQLRPETEGDPLTGVQSLRVRLPNALDGVLLRVKIEGLKQGTVVAEGEADVEVQANVQVTLDVSLGAPNPSSDAGVCDSSCPGCCQAGVCVIPSAQQCGKNGSACLACPAGSECVDGACACTASACPDGCCADNLCQRDDVLQCGAQGGACTACTALVADNCMDGNCRCGSGTACAAGQACVGGQCVCNGQSCPSGCCSGTACLSGDEMNACGNAGQACNVCGVGQTCTSGSCSLCSQTCLTGCCSGSTCHARSVATCGALGGSCNACDPLRADSCSINGNCRCGSGPPCQAGQHCVGGACVCDAQSCTSGCCDGTSCQTRGFDHCGTGGATCAACSIMLADNCSSLGQCRCGTDMACAVGQRCVSSTCQCDAISCPNGCCAGGVCKPLSVGECAPAGETCAPCDSQRADNCGTSACQCGSTPACAVGQRCVGGVCECDGTSCPGGCCNQGACHPGDTLTACGEGGASCQLCSSTRADTCSANGQCQCGSGPACVAGQECVAGACACTTNSCQGCCQGTACETGDQQNACGDNGAACQDCGALACVEGVCL